VFCRRRRGVSNTATLQKRPRSARRFANSTRDNRLKLPLTHWPRTSKKVNELCFDLDLPVWLAYQVPYFAGLGRAELACRHSSAKSPQVRSWVFQAMPVAYMYLMSLPQSMAYLDCNAFPQCRPLLTLRFAS
jgi:hypothetical protein